MTLVNRTDPRLLAGLARALTMEVEVATQLGKPRLVWTLSPTNFHPLELDPDVDITSPDVQQMRLGLTATVLGVDTSYLEDMLRSGMPVATSLRGMPDMKIRYRTAEDNPDFEDGERIAELVYDPS